MRQNAVPSSILQALARIVAHSGRSYFEVIVEFCRVRLGLGRLSFADYDGLRLYDQSLYGDVDKSRFVGFRASQKIWMQANHRVDLFGLVNNKLAADILFAAHGFPVLQSFALFREQVGLENAFLIRTDSDLRTFLSNDQNYPFFGKPISGHQSLGSASIDHYDRVSDRLITSTGQYFTMDQFVAYVRTHATSGYVFQRRLLPHAAIRLLCGNRVATVRVLTILSKGQPQILRACWKIPAGSNVADNFWRDGNLLAQLDLESGQVKRVLRRDGLGFSEITHHPESGLPITGTYVPQWTEVKRIALEATRVVEDIPLVGWDIAPVDDGAVLVELNETPDFRLHQLADRRGIVDDVLSNFLADRKTDATLILRAARKHNRGQ